MRKDMEAIYLLAIDIIIYAMSAIISWLIRMGYNTEEFHKFLPYLIISTLVSAGVFSYIGVHKHHAKFFSLHDLVILFVATGASTLLSLFVLFTISRFSDISRAIPAIHWGVSFAFLTTVHFMGRIYSTWKDFRKRADGNDRISRQYALILGYGPLADICLRMLDVVYGGRFHVVGILDENTAFHGRRLRLKEVLGGPEDLPIILTNYSSQGVKISHLILAIPKEVLSSESKKIIEGLDIENRVIIKDFCGLLENFLSSGSRTGGVGVEDLVPLPKGMEEDIIKNISNYVPIKRILDIVGSGLLLGVALPVMALVALSIKLTMGSPVIFWQERPGRNGRIFRLYKFRTMLPAADAEGKLLSDEERQTRIGRFLRRYRIDELPQLFNILIGDMSFIGPRPMLPIPRFTPVDMPSWLRIRALVRPGITGWAQVLGGQAVDKREKVILDAWYLKNMSLKLDLYILWKTAEIVFLGERVDHETINRCIHEILGEGRNKILQKKDEE